MFYKNLQDIPKFIKLSKIEQHNHIIRAKNGEQESIDLLINNCYKLVLQIANKFKNDKLELEDLVQEGILGLYEAIERFNLEKENKFLTYAYSWIINRIGDYCRRNGSVVRLPNYLINDSKKVKKYQQEYWKKYSKLPNNNNICENFKFTPKKLERINSVSLQNISLNTNIGDGESTDFFNYIPVKFSKPNKYVEIFDVLTEQEREMLELNSGLWNGGAKVSYKNLAIKYGMSFKDIRCILNRSKSKIRKELEKIKEK